MFPVTQEPLDQQHNDDGKAEPRHAGCVRTREQRRGAYTPHVIPRLPDAVGPEDDPPDGGQEEGQQHLSGLLQGREKPSLSDRILVFPVLADEDKRQEKNRMERAPGDKRPVRPMPQTADQEDHEGVPDDLRLGAPASAQRDIHVIPEPGGQGYMPATPELGDIPAEIREAEVPHRLESEQLSNADGHVRVTREIAIDLESEENGRQQQRTAALRLVGREDAVHVHRAVIGNHHLLEQAPQNLAHAVHAHLILEGPGPGQLRQQIRRPLDRAGQQLREETHVCEILDDVPCRLQLSTIHVDTVAQRLERVEADADGKDRLEKQTVRLPAEERIRKGGDEEIVILENAQNQQVDDDVQHIGRLRLPGRIPIFLDKQAAYVAEQRREGQQHQEPPVPPSVKDVGRRHDKEVLQFQVLSEDEPIEQKHYREENGEFQGVEKHYFLIMTNARLTTFFTF